MERSFLSSSAFISFHILSPFLFLSVAILLESHISKQRSCEGCPVMCLSLGISGCYSGCIDTLCLHPLGCAHTCSCTYTSAIFWLPMLFVKHSSRLLSALNASLCKMCLPDVSLQFHMSPASLCLSVSLSHLAASNYHLYFSFCPYIYLPVYLFLLFLTCIWHYMNQNHQWGVKSNESYSEA